ncbi:MAG: hypothetical protein ACPGR2_12740 [Psychrobium sp.]
MNRDKLDFSVSQAIGASLFMWFLVFIWGELPSNGLGWMLATLVVGLLMISSAVVIVTGFSSVQYQFTRSFLAFAMGALVAFIISQLFNWRGNEWYEYAIGLAILVGVMKLFDKLFEKKNFQRYFEALLISLLAINILRIIPML